ncbi:MAG TPA: hypothetical protein VLL76_08670 [Candidatus Omnitrophota bacterium]|nr:hypothetical protein [Candidatus Omnitrophota bacterium]
MSPELHDRLIENITHRIWGRDVGPSIGIYQEACRILTAARCAFEDEGVDIEQASNIRKALVALLDLVSDTDFERYDPEVAAAVANARRALGEE